MNISIRSTLLTIATVLLFGCTDGGSDTHASLRYLSLAIADSALNKDSKTSISLQATYDDNSTDTPDSIEWLIAPKNAAAINGNTLTALKEANVTIRAKIGNITSNQVNLNIYLEIDGYRLPPEPDPRINNATVAGIDSNHNGIRDDIERWIYLKMKIVFPEHKRIERAMAMQHGRIIQKVLLHPENARELYHEFHKAVNCFMFYKIGTHGRRYPIAYNVFDNTYRDVAFNTKARHKAYWKYNKLLSGDIYPMERIHPDQCDFDYKRMLREVQQ